MVADERDDRVRLLGRRDAERQTAEVAVQLEVVDHVAAVDPRDVVAERRHRLGVAVARRRLAPERGGDRGAEGGVPTPLTPSAPPPRRALWSPQPAATRGRASTSAPLAGT